MGIGTWGALILLAQVSSPPECARGFDLLPSAGALDSTTEKFEPYAAALREDLLCAGEGSPVLMVMNSSITDMPETAVFVARSAEATKAKVIVRRYRENVWIAMHGWFNPRAKSKAGFTTEREQRAALAAARKFDVFEADIDAATVEVIARVWSLMIDRARPDPRLPRVIVHSHVSYGFQSGDRFAAGRGRTEGGVAHQLIALGNDLVSYASAAAAARPGLRDQLASAAAALEARLKSLKTCPSAE